MSGPSSATVTLTVTPTSNPGRLVNLAIRSYTAQVSGIANATGVALVEVYTLNP